MNETKRITVFNIECPNCKSRNTHIIDYEVGVIVFECNDCKHKFNRFESEL